MEPSFMLELPKEQLKEKENYEPILLECLNSIPIFRKMSEGGFSAPQSESNGQCDAIGKNGYSIDFKLLLSQEGAQNMNETSLTRENLCEGVTMIGPSRASTRGIESLPFPSLWGFLRTHSLSLNENGEIELLCEADNMEKTIKSLTKMIRTKKNLLFFHPNRLISREVHKYPTESICGYAGEALSIISKARKLVMHEYETYYALLMDDKMVFLSGGFAHMGCIDLTSLGTWRKLCISL